MVASNSQFEIDVWFEVAVSDLEPQQMLIMRTAGWLLETLIFCTLIFRTLRPREIHSN